MINNRVVAVSLTVRFQGSNSTPCVLAGGFGARCTELSCCLLWGGGGGGGSCFFLLGRSNKENGRGKLIPCACS